MSQSTKTRVRSMKLKWGELKLTLWDLLALPSLLGAYIHHVRGAGPYFMSVPASVPLSLDCHLYSVSPGLTQACYLSLPWFSRSQWGPWLSPASLAQLVLTVVQCQVEQTQQGLCHSHHQLPKPLPTSSNPTFAAPWQLVQWNTECQNL